MGFNRPKLTEKHYLIDIFDTVEDLGIFLKQFVWEKKFKNLKNSTAPKKMDHFTAPFGCELK